MKCVRLSQHLAHWTDGDVFQLSHRRDESSLRRLIRHADSRFIHAVVREARITILLESLFVLHVLS